MRKQTIEEGVGTCLLWSRIQGVVFVHLFGVLPTDKEVGKQFYHSESECFPTIPESENSDRWWTLHRDYVDMCIRSIF